MKQRDPTTTTVASSQQQQSTSTAVYSVSYTAAMEDEPSSSTARAISSRTTTTSTTNTSTVADRGNRRVVHHRSSSTSSAGGAAVAFATLLFISHFTRTQTFPVRQNLLDEVTDQLGWPADNEQTRLKHELQAYLHQMRAHRHHRHKQNWLREALVYLRDFGYLNPETPLTPDYVETALAAFQKVSGMPTSGSLNADTIRSMRKPRCGNADMPVRAHSGEHRAKRFAKVSKWENKMRAGTLELTWYIAKYTDKIDHSKIKETVREAFELWSQQIQHPRLSTVKLSFAEASNADEADINILWASGEHGDGHPFDAAGQSSNILAHTFYPKYQSSGTLNGDIHFDEHENWVLEDCERETKAMCFPYVLVHEIGHALGLGHSNDFTAVMNPHYKSRPLQTVTLAEDDKCAVNWNYVGSTMRCMWLFVMVELMPRVGQNTAAMDELTSTMHDHNAGSDDDDPETLRNKMNEALATLNESIPACSDSNDVQTQAEVLLENHMDFPQDASRSFGPVVCNFFDGLANMVQLRTGQMVRRRDALSTLTAHVYPHSVSRSLRHYQDFDELSDAAAADHNSLRRRRRKRSRGSSLTAKYTPDYFNEQFFESLLSDLVVTR